MAVKEVSKGYLIDFTIGHIRYREVIPSLHNKTSLATISDREVTYRMAVTTSDETALTRYPNSKILQKAFKSEKDELTINDYWRIWYQRGQSQWELSTKRGYNQKLRCYILPNFGNVRLKEFRPSMFQDWAAKQTLSGKSLNETLNIMNGIFETAFHDEVIEKNPIKLIRRYKQEHKEPSPFTKDEIIKILAALETPYREFFQFAIYTGLRTGELLALRWEDVDMDRKVAHIRKNITNGHEKEPKTKGSIRTIELQPEALDALECIKSSCFLDSYRVFIDPNTRKTYKYADGLRKYTWIPALKKAGVKYRYPYQCRHTFASTMLSDGKNPMWVAAQMGHADWGMIRKVYGRWLSNNMRAIDEVKEC